MRLIQDLHFSRGCLQGNIDRTAAREKKRLILNVLDQTALKARHANCLSAIFLVVVRATNQHGHVKSMLFQMNLIISFEVTNSIKKKGLKDIVVTNRHVCIDMVFPQIYTIQNQ